MRVLRLGGARGGDKGRDQRRKERLAAEAETRRKELEESQKRALEEAQARAAESVIEEFTETAAELSRRPVVLDKAPPPEAPPAAPVPAEEFTALLTAEAEGDGSAAVTAEASA